MSEDRIKRLKVPVRSAGGFTQQERGGNQGSLLFLALKAALEPIELELGGIRRLKCQLGKESLAGRIAGSDLFELHQIRTANDGIFHGCVLGAARTRDGRAPTRPISRRGLHADHRRSGQMSPVVASHRAR
jgi:hypothetical protein